MSLDGCALSKSQSYPTVDQSAIQRHTSLEGRKIECLPLPPSLKPRLARVKTTLVRTLIWKLVRNANQSANGDHQLVTVLVQKWLVNALGARLGNYFYELAFPETPSPVNLSSPTSRDGMSHHPKPTTPMAEGEPLVSLPNFLKTPSASISLFTREDEI